MIIYSSSFLSSSLVGRPSVSTFTHTCRSYMNFAIIALVLIAVDGITYSVSSRNFDKTQTLFYQTVQR